MTSRALRATAGSLRSRYHVGAIPLSQRGWLPGCARSFARARNSRGIADVRCSPLLHESRTVLHDPQIVMRASRRSRDREGAARTLQTAGGTVRKLILNSLSLLAIAG